MASLNRTRTIVFLLLFFSLVGHGFLTWVNLSEPGIDRNTSVEDSSVTETDSDYEEEDVDPQFVATSEDTLNISREGFGFKKADLNVGDFLRVTNQDNRDHLLTIEVMGVEKRVQSGETVRIEIQSAGDYKLESDRFENDHVKLDINPN